MKYYFCDQIHPENCFTIDKVLLFMISNKLKSLEVFEAKTERNIDMFFCKHYGEVGEKNTCNKIDCAKYAPRNEKTGICKHYGFLYEKGKKFKITIKKQAL